MEPLNAPRREHAQNLRNESDKDRGALALIVALALGIVAAIGYAHFQSGHTPAGAPGEETIADAGAAPGTDGYGSLPRSAAGSAGLRKEMVEQPLQRADALPTERYAAPVSHVTDSDNCRDLRSQRDNMRERIRKAASKADAEERKLDLRSIENRGTQLGCWSGGAG